MLRNILLIFFRKISRSDIYAIINLVGLSIGITACLLIFLFVRDELRFDRHHEQSQDIYRLLLRNKETGAASAIRPGVMHDHLYDRIPGIESMARLFFWPECVITSDDRPLVENEIILADIEIFDIFSFRFIEGDPATALSDPFSLIITEEAARRHFGDADPIGQQLVIENELPLMVTGIVEGFPAQSHFHFNMIGHISLLELMNPSALTDWQNSGVYFYFKLGHEADPALIAGQVTGMVRAVNENFRETNEYFLQPLHDIRLHSKNIAWDEAKKGDITVVMVFIAIALLTLLLACFNFVNLSIATAIRRAREIGIKKVLGATRGQMILQFLLETSLLVLAALLLAAVLTEVFLPMLNNLTGKQLSLDLFTDPVLLLVIVALLIIVSLLAGAYPAFVMSRYKAINAMKGDQTIGQIRGFGKKRYQFRLRQLLILFQFAVSIALIVASLVIFWQMRFLSTGNPGYEREGLITIKNPWDAQSPSRAAWLKEQMLQHSGVSAASLAHNIPPVKPSNYGHVAIEGDPDRQHLHVGFISVDADYFSTLGSNIIAGRDFSAEHATEAGHAAIVNAAAAARLPADDIIGARLQGFYDGQTRSIVGVVDNIHFSSLHEAVTPMVFYISEDRYPQNWFNILVRHEEGRGREVLTYLQQLWGNEVPQWPLQYQFVDEQYMAHYSDDRRVMTIVASFAVLAIVLSVMGLLSLSVYATAARTKEIGIRKVLGASVKGITGMISNEFGIIVILSNILAWPVAYIFINRWLDNFAYRIDVSLLAFLIPALAMYLIAVATVSIIGYRAASLNPVDALRNQE